MAPRGEDLFRQAEAVYSQDRFSEALELYRLALRKILKDEDISTPVTSDMGNAPRMILTCVWMNFVGFIREPRFQSVVG